MSSSTIIAPQPLTCPGCQCPLPSPAPPVCRCGCAIPPSLRQQQQGPRGFVPPVAPAIRNAVHLVVQFMVDRTLSSGPFEKYIAEAIEFVCETVLQEAKLVHAALYTGGDLEVGEELLMHTSQPEPISKTGDGKISGEALKMARSIQFGGGGDIPETHLENLDRLLQMIPPAKAFERHVVVGFMTDVSKPLPSGKTPADLGALFLKRRVEVVLACNPCPLLSEFAKAANGELIPLTDPPSDISRSELRRVALAVARSITARRTI